MIELEQAMRLVLGFKSRIQKISTPLLQAQSAVLAEDIFADRAFPPYNKALMDGFCAQAQDFKNGAAQLTLVGQTHAGTQPDFQIRAGQTAKIMTGAALPEGADLVIPIEQAQVAEQQIRLVADNPQKGLFVGLSGQDAQSGECLLNAGIRLDPQKTAICAAVGKSRIEVWAQPTVFVLTGGTEIVPIDQIPKTEQIRDVNQYLLAANLQRLGIQASFQSIAQDNLEDLKQLIQLGLAHDIILVCGGVSKGDSDFTAQALVALGAKTLFHGVKLKPGKPLWFGGLKKTALFGLPGNPVSVQTCFKLLVEPYLNKFCQQKKPEPAYTPYPLYSPIFSPKHLDHFLPAKRIVEKRQTFIEPLKLNNSGDFAKLKDSHGLVRCPLGVEQLTANMQADFLQW